MAKIVIPDEWWSAPAQSSDGQLIIVTGRRNMDEIIAMRVYNYRIEVTWRYAPDASGMPDYATSVLMEQVTDAMQAAFTRDPVAIVTGIYTGAGERNWVFYTRSLHIFQRKLNEILAPLPVLPLEFYAADDPDWEEYREMRETEIAIE